MIALAERRVRIGARSHGRQENLVRWFLFTFPVASETLFDAFGVFTGRAACFFSGRYCQAAQGEVEHQCRHGGCYGGNAIPVWNSYHVLALFVADIAFERIKIFAERLTIDASISMIFAVYS
jgi:hypothetical protein